MTRRLARGVAAGAVAIALPLLGAATPGQADRTSSIREIVIVSTNDFESAIEPIEAFWMEGSPLLGGAAHLDTRIDAIRAREAARGVPTFLFDSGDMFTGLLSRLTEGEVMIEMMITMGYDAMGIGNHEFDYGSEVFLAQAWRAPFPILSANTFWKGTDIHYTRPHAIVERDGFRIGVIGIIGRDAISVVVPSLVDDLEFRDPEPWLAASVAELEPEVDLIVVLAHQGKTGPMQSDQEAHPELARDFEEDVAVTSAVPGIDVLLGGHAHVGIEEPFVNPATGTIITQTYGHGTRLGFLRLWVDTRTGEVVRHEGELVKTFVHEYPADPVMTAKMREYAERHAGEIATPVGRLQQRLIRLYNEESPLGSFVADVMRAETGADVGLMNAGGLRADLPAGTVTTGDVRDALPFLNLVVTVDMTGAQLREVLEQGLTLERGMIQVSGLRAEYDLARPPGARLLAVRVGGEPLDESRRYRVATNSFVAEGGDLYTTFRGLPWSVNTGRSIADVVIGWFEALAAPAPVPTPGRLNPR